ncbi:hypothetical protein [Acinetobacter junii]|uniref:hypothetical protein n=1 Tax=Acinetobacter junii TaxID=40215 RepID=UPI001901DA3C|nr:hypothetical protein [Acinetobacter junii]MBJ8440040.1 hypothetical protein [Acinetobacter junii]
MKFKILLAGLLLSSQVQAASELVEKNQALAVVKNYANAIACGTTFQKDENGKIQASTKDVFVIENGEDDFSSSVMYVLWGGDQRCAGGNGTSYSVLTEVVKWTSSRPYIVNGDYPFGEDVDKHINYRFISEFKQLGANLFKITSGKFAEDDSDAGPSLQDTILVENQDGAGWKVISSKVSKID